MSYPQFRFAWRLTNEGVELFCRLIDQFKDHEKEYDRVGKASRFLRKYYLGEAYEKVIVELVDS